MSRSNPNENGNPNPSTRWFEWNGEHGLVRYYDKQAEQQVEVGDDFTFMLLDQLGTVKGWHDASDSGIYANEVKDTRQDVLDQCTAPWRGTNVNYSFDMFEVTLNSGKRKLLGKK